MSQFKFGDIIIVNNRRAVVVNVKEFQLSVNPEYYYTICYEGDNKIKQSREIQSTSLEMRYKRVSNFMHMTDLRKFIVNLLRQTEDINDQVICETIMKYFPVTQDVAKVIYKAS